MSSESAGGRSWLPWLLGVALTAGVVAARVAIGFDGTDNPALVMLVVPILVAALLGGIGPGLLGPPSPPSGRATSCCPRATASRSATGSTRCSGSA